MKNNVKICSILNYKSNFQEKTPDNDNYDVDNKLITLIQDLHQDLQLAQTTIDRNLRSDQKEFFIKIFQAGIEAMDEAVSEMHDSGLINFY